MIKIKNYQIEEVNNFLNSIILGKVNIKTALKIESLINAVKEPFSSFQKINNELFKEYGEENGGVYHVPPKSKRFAEFKAKFTELQNVEFDLNVDPISLGELGEIELTTRQLLTAKDVGIIF